MNRLYLRWVGGIALAVLVTGCGSELEVTNVNSPETSRVLAKPADVEKLIGDSYLSFFYAPTYYSNIAAQTSAMSFEHSPMAANFGMIERSAIPRTAPNNRVSDQFATQYYYSWSQAYKAIRAASDGIKQIDAGMSLGSAAADNRARAFARLVQGLSLGHLAMTYDSVFVVDEKTDIATVKFVSYQDGMTAALAKLDEAIAIASSTSFTLPATWINGQALSSADFIKLARSYKAYYRANVARTPTERAAVAWTSVIADAQAGITADFKVTSDYNNWYFGMQEIYSFYGAWNQINYFYTGMADTSGNFQAWLATPLTSRSPFIVCTPDNRWPRGCSLAEQSAGGTTNGRYIAWNGTGGHARSDRGTWRWSYYKNNRYQAFYSGGYLGPMTVLPKAELDFLQAEGYIRGNQPASALPIINASRAAAGLPAADVNGVSGTACVPKLPNGTCGSLLEAMKYEKRLETQYFGGWYYNGRGWGDLIEGTPVHYPAPARELETLGLPLYTRGGVGQVGGAAKGTYGY